jgi:hypothetical protein
MRAARPTYLISHAVIILMTILGDEYKLPVHLIDDVTTAFRTVLGPTQPPVQWVPGALYLGIKRLGREANHSPPASAEVKE